MVILETKDWAQATFGECELGDSRRTKRLVKLAVQAAARPDGSTPEQTESWEIVRRHIACSIRTT